MPISAGAEGETGATPFAEMTPQQIEGEFRKRLLPRIFPVHAALSALRENGGSVVLLTTDAGRYATPGESVLGAVGASVIIMTKVLAKEFGRFKIRVNSIAMALTEGTPTWDRLVAGEGFQRDLFAKVMERFPFGRAPSADEVAAVAVFLASDAAAQVTGQTISVNGACPLGAGSRAALGLHAGSRSAPWPLMTTERAASCPTTQAQLPVSRALILARTSGKT